MKKFTKKERSTFKYWFAHWCAFQMIALNLGCWKFKYIFHDFEKPWLKLIWGYKRVQTFHRNHNKHHLQYGKIHGYDKVDWEALMIDWECSGYTKESCPLTARGEALSIMNNNHKENYTQIFYEYLFPLLEKYNL